ncbi:hypothetical protein [Hymenobacter arizonensis]|uniref:hypothetical protein n=1 Tax=Hymenobacter arizonensis TaxID=1227077 RepID=UPI0011603CBE|nr:hypothetical protein [Hymenobacter arizonensis]
MQLPVLLRWLLVLAALLLFDTPGWGQQNLFNIPAGDLTPKSKFFLQKQVNVLSTQDLESKTHVVYGLGHGWEAGLNVVNVKLNLRREAELVASNQHDRRAPMQPLVQATAQKFFFLSNNLKTSVGTQVGTTPVRAVGASRLTHFTYNTWVLEPRHHLKFVAGPYLSDWGTVGAGSQAGLLLGLEVPLTKDLLMMADAVTGTNASGVSVLGINYLLTQRVQLCLGAMLPNPRSGNSAGIVLELNLLGYDDDENPPPTL